MDERRSAWKTFAIWFGAFVALIIIAHTLLVGGTRHRVDVELAWIKARGEPINTTDLAGPRIPDQDNGGVLYEQAFQLVKSPALSADVNAVELFDTQSTDAEAWAKIAPSLAKIQGVKHILEDAQSRPKCRFKRNWEAGFAIMFPEYGQIRHLARILAADAVANARAGRMDDAIHSIELAYRLDGSINDEPVLIGALVRNAIIRINGKSLQTSLRYGRISEAQSRRLYDLLSSIDLRPGYVRSMQGERVFGLWAFHNARQLGDLGAISGSKLDPMRFVGTYPLRPLLNVDEATYLRLMRRQIEHASMTCLEMKQKGIRDIGQSSFPSYAVISKLLVPVYNRAAFSRDKATAELALARTFLAAQAYRDRFGAYPSSLQQLRARLGWTLPPDPFSGHDLRYIVRPGGFALYSLGPNMKDDGATDSDSFDPTKPGDIVWESGR